MTERALTLLLSFALCFALLAIRFLPTHDGPNHLANCVLGAKLQDPASPLHTYLERGAPLTGGAYQLACEPLVPLLGWRWAHQLLLAAMSLCWALGLRFLARALEVRGAFAWFGFATAVPWCLEMGFYPFFMSIALAPWLLGWVARRPSPRWYDWLAWAGTLLVLSQAHAFGALLAAIALGLMVVLRERSVHAATAAALRAALLGALVLLIIGLTRRDFGGADNPPLALGLGERAAVLVDTFVGGPPLLAWPPMLVSLAALAGLAWALLRGRLSLSARGVAVFCWLSALAALLSPLHLSGWSYFSPRFLPLGLGLAPLALPALSRVRLRRVLEVGTAMLALSNLGLGWQVHRQLQPRVAEILEVAQAPLVRSGVRLPLMLSEWTGAFWSQAPLASLGHLFLFEQGGIDPYLWADAPALDPLLYRPGVLAAFPAAPGRAMAAALDCPTCPPRDFQALYYAFAGRRYQDVMLVADDPRFLRSFLAHGYRSLHRAGRASILEPQQCTVRLELSRAEPGPLEVPLTLRLGWVGLEETAEARVLAARSIHLGPELLPLEIRGPDCGLLWLRVEGEGMRCAGVDAAHVLGVEATPEQPGVVRCELINAPASDP